MGTLRNEESTRFEAIVHTRAIQSLLLATCIHVDALHCVISRVTHVHNVWEHGGGREAGRVVEPCNDDVTNRVTSCCCTLAREVRNDT